MEGLGAVKKMRKVWGNIEKTVWNAFFAGKYSRKAFIKTCLKIENNQNRKEIQGTFKYPINSDFKHTRPKKLKLNIGQCSF